MNIYELEFFSLCPINKIRVKYEWKIETHKVIEVEKLIEAVDGVSGFHESIADDLKNLFGGRQTIKAFHHGVTIRTER